MGETTSKQQTVYVAPRLLSVSFRSERGFASSLTEQMKLWQLDENNDLLVYTDQNHAEIYTVEDDWHQGTYGFWD